MSQVHESEVEINEWLDQMSASIDVKHVAQSAYLTENTENGQPGYVVSVWYETK